MGPFEGRRGGRTYDISGVMGSTVLLAKRMGNAVGVSIAAMGPVQSQSVLQLLHKW